MSIRRSKTVAYSDSLFCIFDFILDKIYLPKDLLNFNFYILFLHFILKLIILVSKYIIHRIETGKNVGFVRSLTLKRKLNSKEWSSVFKTTEKLFF